MGMDQLEKEAREIMSKLSGLEEGSEQYKQLLNNLRSIQELLLKEREMRVKESEMETKSVVDKARSSVEARKAEIYDKEIEIRQHDLDARVRNDKRQAILAYTKIIVGSIGTVGTILLVAACEEEKVLRSKGFAYVKNFAYRFL